MARLQSTQFFDRCGSVCIGKQLQDSARRLHAPSNRRAFPHVARQLNQSRCWTALGCFFNGLSCPIGTAVVHHENFRIASDGPGDHLLQEQRKASTFHCRQG